jgi:antitoxin PrlF
LEQILYLIVLTNQNYQIHQEAGMADCKKSSESDGDCGCYKVQALVTVDERGQMVLPKDVRDRAGIQARDKLALTTIEKDGEICCILLTKADALVQVVQSTLGTAIQAPRKD